MNPDWDGVMKAQARQSKWNNTNQGPLQNARVARALAALHSLDNTTFQFPEPRRIINDAIAILEGRDG